MQMFENFIADAFMACVYILQVIGGSPGEFGFGYYLANLLIFVVIQPALILMFFTLWIREKRKNKKALETQIRN
jgi:hypothetical protein